MIHISSFVGHMVSVSNTQLCHWSRKAAKGNEFINKDACISMKLYLRNRQWDHQGKWKSKLQWHSVVAPTNTNVHMVEETPRNGCWQCLHPHGGLQLLPASMGNFPRPEELRAPPRWRIVTPRWDPRLVGTRGSWLRFLEHHPVISSPTNQKKVKNLEVITPNVPLETLP